MASNGTPVYHDAADGGKPKTAKNPVFLAFPAFGIYTSVISHMKEVRRERCPPHPCQDGRRGGRTGLWANGPGGPLPAAAAEGAFLLNSPRFPTGDGRGTKHETGAKRPPLCPVRAASPPDGRYGGGAARRAGRTPAQPGQDGQAHRQRNLQPA